MKKLLLVIGLLLASVSAFAQPPKATLEQARNGTAASPVSPMNFQTGNLGGSTSHFVECTSAPYRLLMENFALGTHTVIIEWDIRNSGANATDYITEYDNVQPHNFTPSHTQEVIDPLLGATGTYGSPSTFPIPAPSSAGSPIAGQPTTVFNSLPAADRVMTIWNGTITSMSYVSQGSLTAASSSTRLSITFTATSPNVVLAWGGHLASRAIWGDGNSAGGISGSPFHMRLIEFDGTGGNQDRSLSADAVLPDPLADLSLVKTVNNPTAQVGSTVTFTIAVTNSGPDVATNVTVGDVVPSGFTYVANSIAGGTSRSAASAPTLSWSISSLAVGATTNLTFQAVVNATGNYTNVAEVTASDQKDPDSQPDPTPDNDTPTQDDEDDAIVTPTAVADLSLVKSVNNPTAQVGSTVTFTIALTNNGPSTATNVSVGDVIPSGFTYVANSISGGTSRSAASAPTLSWTIASLASGASTNLTFQAVVNATGNYTNVAEVTASDQNDPDSQPDPTPDNDTPTQDDEDDATVTPTAVADLSLVKSVNNPTAQVGSTVTFTIAVTNNGPSTATNVAIGDVIPSGFAYVPNSISGGTTRSAASAPTLSWSIASLTNGSTVNLSYQATVNASGNYTNVAQVTASDQADPNSTPNNQNGPPYENDEDDATVTPTAVADLSLVKSVNNPTAQVGSTVTFTIAVTNNGPSTATNVSVGDVIPSGFTYVANSISGGSSHSFTAPATLLWNISSLTIGATLNLSFQAVVNATGNYTNVAQVTAADQNDPDSSPNNENGAPYEDDEDDAVVTPTAVADLSLQKSIDNVSATIGSTVTFTIAVTNSGPSTATNVAVGDVIPSGFAYVPNSITGGTTRNDAGAPTLTWTISGLAKDATVNLTYQAVVNASGNYTNVAQVTASDQHDPDSTPNNENGAPYEDDESAVTLNPGAGVSDLSLQKSVNDPTAAIGATVTFTLAVTNDGPNTATNVSLGDVIPSGFTYVANSISGGTTRNDANAPTLSWSFASIANGATVNVTYQAVVNATGNHTNLAQITASDQNDPDSSPNNENGMPYEDDEDGSTVTPTAFADLSLVKSVNNPTASVGSTVTFTIVVTNNGPDGATNVTVGDVIPSGFTYVANSITGGSSRSATNAPDLNWSIASLTNGSTVNLSYQATVNASGNYTNVAQVTASDQADPNSTPNNQNGAPYENDEDDATVTPTAVADLSLQKSVNNPTAQVGSTVTFTIAVTNNGPSTATNVSVGDVIPSGFAYVANSISGGSTRSDASAPTLSWSIASLTNGSTVNLSYQAIVNASGNYTNVAQVTASDQPDPDSAPNNENGAPYEDDEDDATVTPTAVADLSLVKSVNNPTAQVGSTVTFTIAVTNNGPSTATNVSIGDVIPNGFAYVANSISGGSTRSDASAPTLSWSIASLTNGSTVNLSYQAIVNASGNYTNVAQVTASDQADPNSTPNNQNGPPYENDEDDATVTPTAVADLSLVKSVNNLTAQVGSTVTFTIAVTNNGPSTATNVSIGDVIPSGFAYVANSITGGSTRSDASAPTLSWSIASLTNGSTVNLSYQAIVNASGNYTNVAQVTASDQADPNSTPNNQNGPPYENDEDDAKVTPVAVADLSLVKSVNNPTANIGTTVTYTLALTNSGPSTATNVSVEDVLPSGFTYVANSISGGTTRSDANAPTLSWTIASIASGATVNLTFQATVNATGPYTNVAQVTASDQPDPDSSPNNNNGPPFEDDESEATVTPANTNTADLSLQKTVNNPTAQVGSTVTFTIAVTNSGPSTATNVRIGDVIPSGFSYVASSISGGSTRSDADAPALSWTIASLTSGATVNLTYQAIVNASGNYTNVAQVTAADQNDPDSSPNNNNPAEDDQDDATVTPSAVADLSLQKSVNNATASVGSTVTFTIAVTNNGPSTATNVSVGDVIPSGFTYVANSISGGSTRSDASAPTLSWSIASIASGNTLNLTYQAVVNATGNYTNVAQVTASDQSDPNSTPNNQNGAPYENDEDDATVTPTAVADLSLVKSVNNPTAQVGSTVTFTIAVTNNGPSTATNVSVGDVIPSGFAYVANSISGGTTRSDASAPTLSWSIGSIANGNTVNLTYQAVVNATGNYTNVAQVTAADQSDPNSTPNNQNGAPYENDEDDATVTPTAVADLSLVKSVNNPTAQVGSTVTFTIAVTNNGPSTATNVSVGDVIPSGFTYVANSIAGGTTRNDASAPTLSWSIGSIANGNTVNLTYQAVVNATGNYTNVAQVTAADQTDPNSTPNNENGAPYENDEDDATVTPMPRTVADLKLEKLVSNSTAAVGSTVTFTIEVSNSGPTTATNVAVGDVIPSGFTYVANSISGGTSRSAANLPTLSWTISSLANGAKVSLTFQAVVNATGNYTNVAQVTASDQDDPDSTPNNLGSKASEDDEDDVTVKPTTPATADLSLVKSVNNPTAQVGSTVTFTIAVTNSGPSTATNVSVGDVIPSGFTYVANSISGGTTRNAASAPTLSWTIASLASGASTNLTFQAVVNATGTYTNVAEVTASDQNDPDSQPDPTPDNDTPTQDDEDDATVTPSAVADLSLLKSVNNPTTTVGSTVTFTIAVTNNGPSTATNVSVGDVIPSGFTYVANSISGGSTRNDASAPTLSWTIASLANGASTNLTFQATVNATGNYTNVAQVTASDLPDPDSSPNNENGAPYEDDEDDATVTPPNPNADLSLLKSVNNTTAQVGSTVTFTIAVTNNGPSTATNVSVGDVIPSGFSYVANSISGGSIRSDANAPTLSWSIASLANGATLNLTYQAVVNATGNYTNIAQVTAADQPDPDSAPNNENGAPYEDDEDDATVTPFSGSLADVCLQKVVDNPSAPVGATVTFAIYVTNYGPSTATNVSVGDVIPSGFTYVANSITGGTSRSAANAPTLSWTISSLGNNETTSLTFQAVVNASGNYTNVAQITASDQPDPDSAPNNENGAPYEDDEDDATVTPAAYTDLSLQKSVNNSSVPVGSTVTFTIAVTNNGPNPATNVAVVDVIPSGYTYVPSSSTGGTTRNLTLPQTLSWTIASLANGATEYLTFQATVNAEGNYTNIAQITASDLPDPDSAPSNENGAPYEDDEDDAVMTATPLADLSLQKSVSDPTAHIGSTVKFTVAVSNLGPSAATNVSVADILPSGFTYVAGSIAGGTSRSFTAPASLSWNIASIASGVTVNLTFEATVNASGNYTNVAQVTASDQPDPNSTPNNENGAPYENDEDDATVTPQPAEADLKLKKSVDKATPMFGETVQFTIEVTNSGPSTATNVSVVDVVPNGYTYVAGSIAGGTTRSDANAPTLSWTISSISDGASVNLTFRAVVNATGNYTNVAQVTASDQPDPDSAPNNENGAPYEDDEDDAVVTPTAAADLRLKKSVNNSTPVFGETVTFTIAVTNDGPNTATNVAVKDVVPNGYSYVAGSIAGGTTRSDANAPTLTWTISSIASGATVNLTFKAVVNTTGNYLNIAQVTASDQPDPDSAPNNEDGAPYEDDEDDAIVTPVAGADLSLKKSVDKASAAVGETVTFTITVTNDGPDAATNVSVSDVIPSGYTYVAGSIAGGTTRSDANAPTLSWSISSIAKGVTVTLSFKAVVNSTGNYTNVAQVTAADQPDPDSAPNNENGAPYEDDEDDAVVTLKTNADLSLQKSVSNPTAQVGSTVTFTIAVTNNGPATATNVQVTDVIPSGYSYVANSIAGGSSRSAGSLPTLSWTISSLANGATTTLTFQAVVNASGNYTNVAQVKASDQGDPDSAPNNENGAPYEDDEDDAVVTPTPVADLSLQKSVNNPSAQPGSTVTFTIAVTNSGPSAATNVKVTDVIPCGYMYVAGSIAGGSTRSDAGAPTLQWTIASMANGSTVNLTFQAVVSSCGSYKNVAQITAADQLDLDSTPNNEDGAPYEDDEDDAIITPSGTADLSLQKSVSNPSAIYGATVTFTIAVTNNGPNTATNVNVSDVLPNGYTYVAGSIAGGTTRSDASAPTLTWSFSSLSNGATSNLTFQAVVNNSGNYKNVAQVTASDQSDPDSSPNNDNGAPYEDDEDDATVTPTSATSTHKPTADAYVRSDKASTNYGKTTTIIAKQSSATYFSLLKFNVSGLSGNVVSAKLRLKVTTASSNGGAIYAVSNNYVGTATAWTETGVKYSNAPTITGNPLSSTGAVTVGQIVEFNVTSAVTGNGTFSFGLKSTSSTTVEYSSKEGSFAPELVIQISGSLTKTTEPAASVDSSTAAMTPMPKQAELLPNYPNPFNAQTLIEYSLPEASNVRLVIYTITGQFVRTLTDGQLPVGSYRVIWDGKNTYGEEVSSGVYIYLLEVGRERISRRMLFQK